MGSKSIVFVSLCLAIVLLITSEVTSRDLAETSTPTEQTNGVDDATYEVEGRGGYNRGHGGHGGHGGLQAEKTDEKATVEVDGYGHGGHGGHGGGGHGGHGGGHGGHGGLEAKQNNGVDQVDGRGGYNRGGRV